MPGRWRMRGVAIIAGLSRPMRGRGAVRTFARLRAAVRSYQRINDAANIVATVIALRQRRLPGGHRDRRVFGVSRPLLGGTGRGEYHRQGGGPVRLGPGAFTSGPVVRDCSGPSAGTCSRGGGAFRRRLRTRWSAGSLAQ